MLSPAEPSPGRRYRRTTYDLRPEQYERLRATARAHGMPTSVLLRHLVDTFFAEYHGVLTLPSISSKEVG